MIIRIKITAYILIVLAILACITHSFWKYEVKYALPTPVPNNHIEVCMGAKVAFEPYMQQQNKPMLLHFFNPLCPCSKFNLKEVMQLYADYGDRIDFKIILQSEDLAEVKNFKEAHGYEMDVMLDSNGEISDVFGIYATPQAVIIDTAGTIYYKGNYNKARFCTNKDTRFVYSALTHLFVGEQLPAYTELVTISYGCSLPSDNPESLGASSLFSQLLQQ